MKDWYSVQVGNDFDCGNGSYDYDEAVAMAESEAVWHPEEEIRIAVCTNGTDCVEREIIIKEGTR
jgi:hypothetical protein